jgi:hypothetical protein
VGTTRNTSRKPRKGSRAAQGVSRVNRLISTQPTTFAQFSDR